MKKAQTVFLTMVQTVEERAYARILIDSIRSFGGALSHCPIWLIEANPQDVPCHNLAGKDVQIMSLNAPDAVPHYYFSKKVAACAQAEQMAASDVQSLVWIDPVCLIAKPPLLFALDYEADAAVRPVHHKNVGLLAETPLDDFWHGVCQAAGVKDIQTTVETFVGQQRIRAYFNTHAFAINPQKRLMRRWFADFASLIGDKAYQKAACQDHLHQVFLHQAILSVLLAVNLTPERLRILPPDYNYPYNLHASVPLERRAAALNDLVCLTYEERTIAPDLVDDIAIHEPLRSWLTGRIAEEIR
jgi:hypothetical protein